MDNTDTLINLLHEHIEQKNPGIEFDKEWLEENLEENVQHMITKWASKKYIEEYHYGDKTKAMKYLPYVDINYDDGFFLRIACRDHDNDTIKILLERGADIGLADVFEWTAYNGNVEGIKLLIEYGADINSLKGSSALTNHPHSRKYFKSIGMI